MMQQARALVDAGIEYAESHGYLVSVAVVDANGRLAWLGRMDGAKFLSADIAQAKAFTSAAFRLSTARLEQNAASKTLFYTGVTLINPGGIAFGQGGLPIWSNDELIGAIGVSGLAPNLDEEVAKAALEEQGFGDPDPNVAQRLAAGWSRMPDQS